MIAETDPSTVNPPTILFVGGGSGGHIFPNLAIAEALAERGFKFRSRFIVSSRPVDRKILEKAGEPYAVAGASPLSWRPRRLMGFVRGYHQTYHLVERLIGQEAGHGREAKSNPDSKPNANARPGEDVAAMIGTGGFVCGPAFNAARRANLPRALVNLDAVPGRANRLIADAKATVFSAYRTKVWPHARIINVPLRQSVQATMSAVEARVRLGLPTDRKTLLITAGSQGARSINRLMIELTRRQAVVDALAGWAVLHLSGPHDERALAEAYEAAGIEARVEPFLDRMGLAWSAANLAISRAGAGSVAEARASRTPSVFYPYPHHKDQHQRFNAAPFVEQGGAVLLSDHDDAPADAKSLEPKLVELLTNHGRLKTMQQLAQTITVDNGASMIADWVSQVLGGS